MKKINRLEIIEKYKYTKKYNLILPLFEIKFKT